MENVKLETTYIYNKKIRQKRQCIYMFTRHNFSLITIKPTTAPSYDTPESHSHNPEGLTASTDY